MTDTSNLPPVRHQPAALDTRAFLLAGLGVAFTLLLLALSVVWVFPSSKSDQALNAPLPSYPRPHLQADPTADLQRLRARDRARLNGLYWQDRTDGAVHLPIEEAMRLVVARDIADWPKAP
jgi:hypothetical protein